MKRIIIVISVLLLTLTLIRLVNGQQGQDSSDGPRIVLEEEEITLLENGKEVKKVYTSKSGPEKKKILKEVESKVFKKLGVQSYKELFNKKLQEQYSKEVVASMHVKKLDDPGLKFLDSNGNVLKELSLKNEKTKTRIKDNRKKSEWEGEKIVARAPKVSAKGKFVVINESVLEAPLATSDYLKEYKSTGYIPTAAISLYDASGKVFFAKVFERGQEIVGAPELVVSDSGTVALITGSAANPQGEDVFHVYNSRGQEMLSYPEDVNGEFLPEKILGLSPDGRYAAVKVVFNFPETSATVFFDLEKKMLWKSDKDLLIEAIMDDGAVTATYQDPYESKIVETIIDLKTVMDDQWK